MKTRRRYSIKSDLIDFRVAKAKSAQERYLRRKDTNDLIKCLRDYGIKEPYATNIALRFYYNAMEAQTITLKQQQ